VRSTTIIIILGFVILIGASALISGQIKKNSEIIQVQLEQAEVLIQNDDWDKASLKINEAYNSWSEAKKWWAIVLNHSSLNSIEISCQRLYQFTLARNATLSLAELNTLKILVKDIPDSESLRIDNIL